MEVEIVILRFFRLRAVFRVVLDLWLRPAGPQRGHDAVVELEGQELATWDGRQQRLVVRRCRIIGEIR